MPSYQSLIPQNFPTLGPSKSNNKWPHRKVSHCTPRAACSLISETTSLYRLFEKNRHAEVSTCTYMGKKCITFKYNTDLMERDIITDLLIYRSIGNGPMVLIDQVAKAGDSNIADQGGIYIDRNILFGQSKTYKYKVQLLFWDGSMSNMSSMYAITYTP